MAVDPYLDRMILSLGKVPGADRALLAALLRATDLLGRVIGDPPGTAAGHGGAVPCPERAGSCPGGIASLLPPGRGSARGSLGEGPSQEEAAVQPSPAVPDPPDSVHPRAVGQTGSPDVRGLQEHHQPVDSRGDGPSRKGNGRLSGRTRPSRSSLCRRGPTLGAADGRPRRRGERARRPHPCPGGLESLAANGGSHSPGAPGQAPGARA